MVNAEMSLCRCAERQGCRFGAGQQVPSDDQDGSSDHDRSGLQRDIDVANALDVPPNALRATFIQWSQVATS